MLAMLCDSTESLCQSHLPEVVEESAAHGQHLVAAFQVDIRGLVEAARDVARPRFSVVRRKPIHSAPSLGQNRGDDRREEVSFVISR